MMDSTTCTLCGGALELRAHATVVGPARVEDRTFHALGCAKDHFVVRKEDRPLLARRAAHALLVDRRLNGTEAMGALLKLARSGLGLTQPELAVLLDLEPETLCRYEKNKYPAPLPIQLALASVLHQVELGAVPADLVRWVRQLSVVSAARRSRHESNVFGLLLSA